MFNQIKVELFRLKKSWFFYLTILSFAIFGFAHSYKKVFIDMIHFPFGDAFMSSISDTSLLFIMSMFVSYFIGSEFTNRTIDNEIRTGYSRLSVIISRAIVVLPASVLSYFVLIITGELVIVFAYGFSTSISISVVLTRFFLFLLQVIAIQSITMFIMFACKKASLGMMLSLAFSFFTCNLLRNYLPNGEFLFKYTSFYRIQLNYSITKVSEIMLSFFSAILTIILMICLTHGVFRKTELK